MPTLLPTNDVGPFKVAPLALGTAALGGQVYAGQLVSWLVGEQIIEMAYDSGVTLFDTAPTYGDAEHVLGRLLPMNTPRCVIATKVDPNASYDDTCRSIEESGRRLRRWKLDIVLLHNPTLHHMVAGCAAIDALRDARQKRRVRLIGASVYTFNEASVAMVLGFDVVQVPYNLLDRWAETLIKLAPQTNVTLVTRSALLRGALTGRPVATVPPITVQAATTMRRRLWATPDQLPAIALRFCVRPGVAATVLGPQSVQEVATATLAVAAGPLPRWRRWLANTVRPSAALMDPRAWDVNTRTNNL